MEKGFELQSQQDCAQRANPERHKKSRLLTFRKRSRAFLARYPWGFRIIAIIWTKANFWALRLKWTIISLKIKKDRYLDVRRKLTVPPQDIVYCSAVEFGATDGLGRVVEGEWDLSNIKFKDLDIAVAIRQLLNGEINWENTAFFKNAEKMIAMGRMPWRCESREDLLVRCKEIEKLLASIRCYGYKSKDELDSEGINWLSRPSYDEVTIAIGRRGQLLFCSSAHRLAIAQALGINKIPVQVAVRHPQWMRFRKDVERYAGNNGGFVSQAPPHPDLVNVPSSQISEETFNLISRAMKSKAGRLLDLGSRWGFFSHKFEELGFECYAVEDRPEDVYFLEYFRSARGRSFRIIKKPLTELDVVRDIHFNIVLAIDVLHQFPGKESGFYGFRNFLKNLSFEELFFLPHSQKASLGTKKNSEMSPEESATFILGEGSFSRVELVGANSAGHNLFRLCS